METPPESEGGVWKGESNEAVGGEPRTPNDSFYEIPAGHPTLHELLLLVRVEQDDGRALLVGTHTKCCVQAIIIQRTGVTPERLVHVNPYDTVMELAADVQIVAMSQQLHSI